MPAADCDPILWNDTRIEITDSCLAIHSPQWAARLRIAKGRLTIERLRRGDATQAWAAADEAATDRPGLSLVDHRIGCASPVQAESLELTLQAGDDAMQVQLQLFADVAGTPRCARGWRSFHGRQPSMLARWQSCCVLIATSG
ncbi:hypothetical protein ACERK3_07270 [Phycisphaerales bacterium AB-hyl4]|uniref:Uncharacterized protein n=1 Tax=Natronomicrosphaera hydrolytica TaxID=3242702 RepID=A0ABV4U3C5_9BACT